MLDSPWAAENFAIKEVMIGELAEAPAVTGFAFVPVFHGVVPLVVG